jgi:hypothetical protein
VTGGAHECRNDKAAAVAISADLFAALQIQKDVNLTHLFNRLIKYLNAVKMNRNS